MIKIVITRETKGQYTEKENNIIRQEPALDGSGAPICKSSGYGNSSEIVMKTEYGVVEVTKTWTKNVTLLEQEIENEEVFSLKRVILAINEGTDL